MNELFTSQVWKFTTNFKFKKSFKRLRLFYVFRVRKGVESVDEAPFVFVFNTDELQQI